MREINVKGLALLKSFEKCKLLAYQDSGGIWTIGWGHTGPEVTQGLVWTQKQADDQLQKDLEKFYHLDEYLTEQVNDNQYSALVCLAYNIGLRALKLSTLIKKINNRDGPDKEWASWNKVNGTISNGLVKRRAAEIALYHTLG